MSNPNPQKGKRFGGRQKGTPNKRHAYSVQERLEQLGIDLVGDIIKEIQSMDSPRDKAKCLLQLLEYCDAKRKAVEISGELNTDSPLKLELKQKSVKELMEIRKEAKSE